MATKKVKLYFVPHHNFTGMSRHLPKFKENRVFIEDDPMWVPQKGDKLVWENSACTILGRYVDYHDNQQHIYLLLNDDNRSFS